MSEQHSLPLVDQRGAAFARLVARVLDALNAAANRRKTEGVNLSDVARKLDCNRSMLSRTLNGSSPNLTLKTVSDLLWALDHEPRDFEADALEDINPELRHFEQLKVHYAYKVIAINIDLDDKVNYDKTKIVMNRQAVYAQ